MTYCKECLSKQQKINELEEEISQLKTKLHYQERTAKEGFFGSSTPSSKIPIKANSSTQCLHNNGGGKVGHEGHGRASAGGQIHNCQFNPSSYTFCSGIYASIPPNTFSGVHQYLWDHARPYVLGNMTGEVLHQNFVFGGYYGVHLLEEDGSGPSGYCLGMGADQSTTALRIDAVGSAGLDMINTQIVTVDSVKGRYIETGNSFAGTCKLFNTACWGIPERSVVVNGGRLELQLFNNVHAGAVGYDLRGTGVLSCIGGDVLDFVNTLLLMEPGTNATFISNIFNTSESQMPVNSSNITSIGNLRIQ